MHRHINVHITTSYFMEANALAPTRIRKPETRVARSSTWTPEEDELLTQLKTNSSTSSWSVLATYFPNKTAPQLAGRWEKVINPQLVKGSWTREEDEEIIRYVNTHGDKDWAKLALILTGRTGKQCRERFKNHLDVSVKHCQWTQEEDNMLIELHSKFGNKWTKISSFFDGRTDNCIKNRWNSTIKKRLERIQKGKPLVMKRGRKPKGSQLPVPMEIPDEPDADNFSSCSSPNTMTSFRPSFGHIELISINSAFIIKTEDNREKIHIPSLSQNRIDLQKMLNDLA